MVLLSHFTKRRERKKVSGGVDIKSEHNGERREVDFQDFQWDVIIWRGATCQQLDGSSNL